MPLENVENIPSTYTEDFKYSKFTPLLANFYPSWTQVRKNRESIGHQFLNVFGLELEEAEIFLNEALNNQYIKTANLGEIYQLYKFSIPHFWDEDIKIEQVIASLDSESYELAEAITVHQFYTIDNSIIFDFEQHLGYIRFHEDRKKYSSIAIKTDLGTETISSDELIVHHVWNVFDEFALLLGLKRRFVKDTLNSTDEKILHKLEDNSSLKERILNVFKFPANSTRIGLINGLGQSLGLIGTETWEANTDVFLIPNPKENIIPETMIVNGKAPLPGQMSVDKENNCIKLESNISISATDIAEATFDGTRIINNKVVLSQGFKQGTFTTPVFNPSNLGFWKTLSTTFTGNVSVDILSFDNEGHTEASNRLLYSSKESIIDIQDQNIDIPIKLRFTLKRNSIIDSSPELSEITLSFGNEEAEVKYIHSVEINTLHDDQYRESLLDEDGLATPELKEYAKELSEVSPIFWDDFVWDEAYWDVVDKNLMGLDVLPHKWDPYLTEKANLYLQNGVGYGNDLLTRLTEDWKAQIHSGYFYIGEKAEETYIFASPSVKTATATNTVILDSIPAQGSPIIVKAEGKYLTQVAFLDNEYNYSISNTETLPSDQAGVFSLSYGNITLDSISVDATPTIIDNKVILSPAPEEDEVTFVYKVIDSFVVDGNTVILSSEYDDIEVIYEDQKDSQYYQVETLDLSPIKNHINSGFIYVTNTLEPASNLVIKADPDLLSNNGHDVSTITVDVIDRHKNPILGASLQASATYGTIELSGQYHNRFIYRYTAPTNIVDEEIVFSVDGTAISKSVTLQIRGIDNDEGI